MPNDVHVIQVGHGWYIETPEGRVGPMETQKEAHAYLSLMQIAMAAGTEVACTDSECFT